MFTSSVSWYIYWIWLLSRPVNVNSIQPEQTPIQFLIAFHGNSIKAKSFLQTLSMYLSGAVVLWNILMLTINYPCWKRHFVCSQTTYVRNAEEVKLQHARYRPFYVIPVGTVVAQPVPSVLAHPGEGGAAKDHGTAIPKHCFWGPGSKNTTLDI